MTKSKSVRMVVAGAFGNHDSFSKLAQVIVKPHHIYDPNVGR